MHRIEFTNEGEYDFNSIPEVLCRMMCDMHDAGPRYHPNSRYTFSFEQHETNKDDFRFGTAKACIQSYLISTKNENKKFNVNAIFPSGSEVKLSVKTLKKN